MCSTQCTVNSMYMYSTFGAGYVDVYRGPVPAVAPDRGHPLVQSHTQRVRVVAPALALVLAVSYVRDDEHLPRPGVLPQGRPDPDDELRVVVGDTTVSVLRTVHPTRTSYSTQDLKQWN